MDLTETVTINAKLYDNKYKPLIAPIPELIKIIDEKTEKIVVILDFLTLEC